MTGWPVAALLGTPVLLALLLAVWPHHHQKEHQ